jgi:hypothetical protein
VAATQPNLPDTARHCAYCGHPIADDAPMPERFGEVFCSEAHADEFVAGVRAARMEALARSTTSVDPSGTADGPARALTAPGQRGSGDFLKRAACWGAPLLLMLAISLFWSGGWAAAGGSLLGVVALLACPLGMYFMMRRMTSTRHQQGTAEAERAGERRRA